MSKIEVYLPDHEVHALTAKFYEQHPKLIGWKTDLLTTRIEPPWKGQLPGGEMGVAKHPIIQFVVVSDHPRPLQRGMGVRHGTVATAWENAFEQARREYRSGPHLVVLDMDDPLEVIFRAVLARHIQEMDSLSQIERDATDHPSGIKSALEAL